MGVQQRQQGSLGPAPLRYCKLQKREVTEEDDGPVGGCSLLVGASSWPSKPNQTTPPPIKSIFIQGEFRGSHEQQDLRVELNEEEGRVRREARLEPLTGISITNNFEILRRRYIDTMERARVRANQRKRSQIEQNNSFLQCRLILNKIEGN